LLGQLKVVGLTLCRDVKLESVYTVLVTVAHKIFPVDDAYTGFLYVRLRDTTSIIRNQ